MVADEVKHLVKRQVAKEVRLQREEMQAQAPGPTSVGSRPTATDIASDEVARLLMQKIRTLAQEERFRLGRLR